MAHSKQESTDRLVRGPTGPNRSEDFKILLVLVRSRVLKFFSVLVRDKPVLVRGPLIGSMFFQAGNGSRPKLGEKGSKILWCGHLNEFGHLTQGFWYQSFCR